MGPTTYPEVTKHRTHIGADFARRFRNHYFTFGTMQTMTWVEKDGETLYDDEAGLLFKIWSKRIVPALYFLRSRWDGIRHGKNRDSMWSD
jgi:hypothetical protein